jgi:DnaK suppressor protein
MTGIADAEALALIAERRDRVLERLASASARLDAVRAARGEWTDEEHDPEGFTLTHEWSTAEGARADLRAELVELDAAEARVAAGEYGICARCGLPIPIEQLRLRPARREHVACAVPR